jgi:hypothetical protein
MSKEPTNDQIRFWLDIRAEECRRQAKIVARRSLVAQEEADAERLQEKEMTLLDRADYLETWSFRHG